MQGFLRVVRIIQSVSGRIAGVGHDELPAAMADGQHEMGASRRSPNFDDHGPSLLHVGENAVRNSSHGDARIYISPTVEVKIQDPPRNRPSDVIIIGEDRTTDKELI